MSLIPPPSTAPASGAPGGSSGTRDAFNAALRSRNAQNNYIAHLKIWETADADAPTGLAPSSAAAPSRKARYLILAVQRDSGKVTLNKAKRNANGSFSIGKDWDLSTLRSVEVTDKTAFTLTLSRSYGWTTDHTREQHLFLSSLVNVYRRYTRNSDGPKCIGITVDSNAQSSSKQQAAIPESQPKQPVRASSPPRPAAPLYPTAAIVREPEREPPRAPTAEPYAIPESTPLARIPSLTRSQSHQPPRVEAQAPPPSRPEVVVSPSKTSLLSPRRPGLARLESAQPLLESSPQVDGPQAPTFASLQAQAAPSLAAPAMSKSQSFQTAATPGPVASSSKDKLSDRLARVALGANSGRSSPTQGAESPTEPPVARPPPMRRGVTAEAGIPQSTAPLERKGSASSSVLSIPSPSGHARARLSAIEPMAARGGKAYERMLLAGTGLKSIGDDEEEEEEEMEEEEQAEMLDALPSSGLSSGLDFVNGSPTRRKKTIMRNGKSISRPRQGDGVDGNAANGNGAVEEEAESDQDNALDNVEELLEGIDFRAGRGDSSKLGVSALGLGGSGAYSATSPAFASRTKGQGTAEIIEASLMSELEALDSANIHSILNGDDRLASVLNHVDAALAQLDSIDSLVAAFRLNLNSRAEDIGFIEGQNRGLQVMNANWRALEKEIEQLQQTVNVPDEDVSVLLDMPFDNDEAITMKEKAAASLYRAILQAKTSQMEENAVGGVAATTERLDEYSSISTEFATRALSFFSTLFSQVTRSLLSDPGRKTLVAPPRPRLTPHDAAEQTLGVYCGLMLYLKEVEPKAFERISAAYLTSAAERYKEECTRLVGTWRMLLRSAAEDEDAFSSFIQDATAGGSTGAASALGRAATVRRIGGAGAKKAKSGGQDGEVSGAEAFNHLLFSIIPLLIHETLFLSDFLHLNSNGWTFASYMELETYFCRRAATLFSEDNNERRSGLREMKGALGLVFGFIETEASKFMEDIEKRDRFQVVGVLAALDAAIIETEESNNEFLTRTLNKLHQKVSASVERFFADQVKAISLTLSKGAQASYASTFRGKKTGRGGLTQAVRILPHFIDRLEAQLLNAQHLNIRMAIDGFYERLESTVIDSLLSLKVEANSTLTTAAAGGDEDKGVMNHQVLLILNMHHLFQEVQKLLQKAPTLRSLVSRAEKIYGESLNHYIHFVLRRPLGKMMDFGDGVELLMRSTPANEVSLHGAYNRASFKRLVKEYTTKDVRKQVDALWKRILKHFDEDEDESFSLVNHTPTSAGSNNGELILGAAAEEEERKTVVGNVWKRCEADFIKELERIIRFQEECYKGSGVTLDCRVDEVVRFFQK